MSYVLTDLIGIKIVEWKAVIGPGVAIGISTSGEVLQMTGGDYCRIASDVDGRDKYLCAIWNNDEARRMHCLGGGGYEIMYDFGRRESYRMRFASSKHKMRIFFGYGDYDNAMN